MPIDGWEEVPTAEVNAQTTGDAGSGQLAGWERFDSSQAVELPAYANGLSEKTPINFSPVSVEDRLRLSVGNDAGKMKFLRNQFSDVKVTEDGDWLVKKQGLWHTVDPDGLGDGDPWARTSSIAAKAGEFAADLADIAPEAAMLASQIGVGVATGGASLPAQAASAGLAGGIAKGVFTSMGKLAGTYEAEPDEQIKDIALEAALNLGGTYIAAGIKPTVGLIAKGLKKTAGAVEGAGGTSRDIFTTVIGAATKAGKDSVEVLLDNVDEVTGHMARASVGGSSEKAISRLASEGIEHTAQIVDSTRGALTNFGGALYKEVLENAPENIPAIKDVVQQLESGLAEQGMGKFTPAGKFVANTADDFIKQMETGGGISPFASDTKSLALVHEAIEAIGKFRGATPRQGAAGAKDLLDLKKALNDVTHRISETAKDESLGPALRVVAGMKERLDAAILPAFELKAPLMSKVTGQSSTNLLREADLAYNQSSRLLDPILKTAAQASKQGSDIPYQNMFNTIRTAASKKQVEKEGLEGALDMIYKYGGKEGQLIRQHAQNIKTKGAAMAFLPRVNPGLIAQTSALGSVSSLVAGHPAAAVSFLAAGAASSPRLAATTIKAALRGKALVASMNPKQLAAFLRTPEALNQWASTIAGAQGVRQQVGTELLQQGMQTIQGGGQQ